MSSRFTNKKLNLRLIHKKPRFVVFAVIEFNFEPMRRSKAVENNATSIGINTVSNLTYIFKNIEMFQQVINFFFVINKV